MKKSIIVILLFMIYNIYANEITIFPEMQGLVETNFDTIQSQDFRSDKNRYLMYSITKDGIITTSKKKYIKEHVLNTNQGILIGTDNGEWGGELIYKNKQDENITIYNNNILGIFYFHDDIYFLRGIAHGYINEGYLISLKWNGSSYMFDKKYSLKEETAIYYIYDNNLYLLSYHSLEKFDGYKVELYLTNEIIKGFDPGCMIINENGIFIGAMGCVVVIEDKKKVKVFTSGV